MHETFLHRLDARTKTVIAFIFVITVVSTPPYYVKSFICYLGLLSWYASFAKIPLSAVLKKAVLVLPFSFFAAIWQPFLHGGETFAGTNLSIIGSWIFANVMIKSFIGACTLTLLILTCPFSEFLYGLRKMKMPYLIVDMLALTYRFIFVFAVEAKKLLNGAKARGYNPRWLGQAMLIGKLIGKLFLNSFEKSERIYGAMVLRGYDGYMPVSNDTALQKKDFITAVFIISIILLVRILVK